MANVFQKGLVKGHFNNAICQIFIIELRFGFEILALFKNVLCFWSESASY